MRLFHYSCCYMKTMINHDGSMINRGRGISNYVSGPCKSFNLSVWRTFLAITMWVNRLSGQGLLISSRSFSLTCLCLTGGRTSCFVRFAGGPSAPVPATSGGLAAGRLDGGDPDGSSRMCLMVCVDAGRIMVGSSPKNRCRAVCKTTQTKRISVATRLDDRYSRTVTDSLVGELRVSVCQRQIDIIFLVRKNRLHYPSSVFRI